jgi:hypothetical protein
MREELIEERTPSTQPSELLNAEAMQLAERLAHALGG